MPGELMIVEGSRFKVESYSKLQEELFNQKEITKLGNNEIEKFREKLKQAIRLRLISQVPVGSCLSGGLDSSTIVATINKLLKEKVKETCSVGKKQKTFSAVFPNFSNDENKYVDALVKGYQLPVTSYKVYPTPEIFFKEIEDFVKTQEEPIISTGPYAQYKLMQLVKKQVTVVLDGQGADEMMAGYLPYYFVYWRQLWRQRKIIKLFEEGWGMKDIVPKYLINKLLKLIGFKQEVLINKLLNKKFVNQYSDEHFSPTNDNLKRRLLEDIFYYSLPSLLRYEDKNSMRFSIEARVPFLDINLLRYLFSLPDEAIIKNGWNKYILRQSTKKLLPAIINQRRNKIGFTTPEYEWFIRMKNKIYSLFLSESFAKRKYFNQAEVLKAFEKFIEGKVDDTMIFWRLINLELWLREFFPNKNNKKDKSDKNKKKEITVEGKTYFRYPIRTKLFKKGDDIVRNVAKYVKAFFKKKKVSGSWFVVVSEKVVAIAQGRSYFIWEIKPSLLAKILSSLVTKTPYGIGLGSPWTMELALREVGWLKIFWAAIVAGLTKSFGIKGLFYKITGDAIRSIDGPTEYSLYPSNVSAKLGPKDPQRVVKKIHKAIISTNQLSIANFLGVVIIDANDLGQNVLGNSTSLKNDFIEKIFSDNPMGQADEQTPLVIVTDEKIKIL